MVKIPNFLEATAHGVLNDILSQFRSDEGYAQPNKYEIVIIPPTKRGGGSQTNMLAGSERSSDLRKISLKAQNVTLPGRSLNTTQDSNIYGPNREVADGVTYADDIVIEFQSTSGLAERVFFENWQRQAFDEKTWNIQYYDDYTGFLEIYLLDRQNKRRYGIKLWEVFPKTINPTALAYDAIDQLFLTGVNFSFRYWTSLDQSQNPDVSVFDKALITIVNSAERNITRNIPKVLNKLGRNL